MVSSSLLLIAVAALALPTLAVWLSWRRRRRLLARIRAEWGARRDRVRNMDAIASYHHALQGSLPGSLQRGSLDDRTWDDLHLDAVFALLDRTESTVGQQALYHRLRTMPIADHLEAFEALMMRMAGDAPARERAQMALARLDAPAGYDLFWLTAPDALPMRRWHVVFPIIAVIMFATIIVSPLWPRVLVVLGIGLTVNFGIRIGTAHRVGPVVAAFRQLGPLIACAQTLVALDGRDASSAGAMSVEPIVGPLRTETPRLRWVGGLAYWVGHDPLGLGEIGVTVFKYLNLFFLLDANALYFGARELRLGAEALRRVIAAVGEVDAAIAVASFRAGTPGWTRPRFSARPGPLVLTDVRHPLVRNAVPNSIALGPPHGVLVTGSNTSGKSTFVRTVGVTAVLAQTINTCLAAEYAAPVLRVRSVIGRSDDLAAGKSYYVMEVEAVLGLVRASTSAAPHLFLFDELFRGTNAVERIAAAEAVLTELIAVADRPDRVIPHFVIAATHDAELVELLRESYTPYHFTDAVGAEGLVFDYRLHPGPAATRNAIALLRLHGAPPTLVARALARAAALDRQRTTV